MEAVFPEALKSLQEADPEVYGIIEDEKKRQWCAFPKHTESERGGNAPSSTVATRFVRILLQ